MNQEIKFEILFNDHSEEHERLYDYIISVKDAKRYYGKIDVTVDKSISKNELHKIVKRQAIEMLKIHPGNFRSFDMCNIEPPSYYINYMD